jgi:hypothetical protein
VCGCDRVASIVKRLWAISGYCAMERRFFFKVLMFSADVRKHKTRKIDVIDIDIFCTIFRVNLNFASASSLSHTNHLA